MKFSHTIIFNNITTDRLEKKILEIIDTLPPHPDILEIGEYNNTIKSISVNSIRELKTWIKLKPFQAKNKLAIIYNAEALTIEAQNSVLKIFEEPPQNSYIFLTTRNYKALLPTIISRCEIIENRTLLKSSNQDYKQIFKDSNLSSQFKWAKEIGDIKNIKEKQETINDFLLNLHNFIIQNQQNNKHTKENLILIEKSLKALKLNVNYKLILENLFVNLKL